MYGIEIDVCRGGRLCPPGWMTRMLGRRSVEAGFYPARGRGKAPPLRIINAFFALLRHAADAAEVPRAQAIVHRTGHALADLIGLLAAIQRDDVAAAQ